MTLTGIWCWREVDYSSQTFWTSTGLHHFGKLGVLNTIHELAVCFRGMSENFQDLKLLKASSNMRLLVIQEEKEP